MYFRMSNKNMSYYDPETVIPEDVKAKIPKSVDLVYWDYYHKEKYFYVDWIRRHRDLGYEPLMGSGVWTWSRLWYDHRLSMDTVKPCYAWSDSISLRSRKYSRPFAVVG